VTPQDELAIRNLLAGYAHCIDRRDADRFVALFAEDALFDVNGHMHRGRAALREFVDGLRNGAPGRHVTLNTSLSAVAVNRVHALSDFMLLKRAADAWAIALVGSYEDLFERDGSAWLFRARRIRFT
jgi:uncharacterized protein (TIGR02246 family)